MERFCLLKKILSDGEPTADPVGYKETIDMYQESDRSSYLKEQEELLYKITGEKHSEENAKEDPEKGVQENDRKSVRLQYLSISRKLVEVFDIIKNYPFEKSTEQNAENDEEKFRELLLKFFTLDHKYALKTVLYSQECTLDFLNEMLLMRYLEKDDNVYFRNNGPTKDVTDSDNEAEEYKKAADYQKNLRRKMLEKPVKTVVPIAPSCSKNAKIPTFGCGYVRMWMYDKNFRNLYEPVIGKSTKYERDKIAKWLKEDLKKYIGLLPKNINPDAESSLFTESSGKVYPNLINYTVKHPDEEVNRILLEKLFGFQLLFAFERYLYPHIQDFDKDGFSNVEDLISKIADLPGCFLRVSIVKFISFQLANLANSAAKNRESLLQMYTKYLENIASDLNQRFDNLLKIFSKRHSKSCEKYEDIVLWIAEIEHNMLQIPTETYGYSNQENMSLYSDSNELIEWCESFPETSFTITAMQKIIESNYKKYSRLLDLTSLPESDT